MSLGFFDKSKLMMALNEVKESPKSLQFIMRWTLMSVSIAEGVHSIVSPETSWWDYWKVRGLPKSLGFNLWGS